MKLWKKILLTFAVVLTLSYAVYDVYWSYFSWRKIATVEQMKFNGRILKFKQLSSPVHSIIDSLYPGLRSTSETETVARILLRGIGIDVEGKECKCDDIGYLIWNNDSINLAYNFEELLGEYWEFGYGLEQYSSPEACFDYWLNYGIYYEGRYLKNLDELSTILYGKPVDQLNTSELIGLVEKRFELQ